MKEKFIADFPIIGKQKNNKYIILFDAYTGMGKSTVSKIIQKYDNSVIINNDEIRNWLNDYSNTSVDKCELQRYRLELLLNNNISCILDSCFSHNWIEKKKYYDSLNVKYYIIRLKCDDKTIKERLSKRTLTEDNYSIANYDDYIWMKENVSRVDDNIVDYVIDTSNNIEEQVKDFINKYNLEC